MNTFEQSTESVIGMYLSCIIPENGIIKIIQEYDNDELVQNHENLMSEMKYHFKNCMDDKIYTLRGYGEIDETINQTEITGSEILQCIYLTYHYDHHESILDDDIDMDDMDYDGFHYGEYYSDY